jgi:chromosome segregation ATPase
MAKNASNSDKELDEIRNRLEWFDEERRKNGKRLSELERQVAQQKRIIDSRESVIAELENRLATTASQLARMSQVDEQLQQFKDELVKLIEQYDLRRVQGLDEIDKLRRVEHETYQREFSEIRKELTPIKPLQEDLELRRTEEVRLSGLIGLLQSRATKLEGLIEDKSRELNFLEEASEGNIHALGKLETGFVEFSKRLEPLEQRIEGASYGLTRSQASIRELTDNLADLKHDMGGWIENIQTGEYERNQRLDSWTRTIEEHREAMERYGREWVKFSDQYKASKMALQTMAEWQKQIEQRQNEASELTRVEANRIKALWDNFVTENDKQWKNFEVDQDQRWSAAQRREKKMLVQIQELALEAEQIEQDKDTLWRVQTAQAEAMKKWPRILLEEVEKAIAHNPNSRRQPALVPVRED